MALRPEPLNVRFPPEEDELVRRAAAELGISMTEFLTTAALSRAHEVVADQREFLLDTESWAAFTALLDQPPVPNPQLVDLFARPPRVEQ